MNIKKKGIAGRWKGQQGVVPCYLCLAVALVSQGELIG